MRLQFQPVSMHSIALIQVDSSDDERCLSHLATGGGTFSTCLAASGHLRIGLHLFTFGRTCIAGRCTGLTSRRSQCAGTCNQFRAQAAKFLATHGNCGTRRMLFMAFRQMGHTVVDGRIASRLTPLRDVQTALVQLVQSSGRFRSRPTFLSSGNSRRDAGQSDRTGRYQHVSSIHFHSPSFDWESPQVQRPSLLPPMTSEENRNETTQSVDAKFNIEHQCFRQSRMADFTMPTSIPITQP